MTKSKISLKELIVFAMLGTIMFLSDLLMEALPNIHAIAMFIALFTLVYRWKALIPLYVYVALTGGYAGLAQWWIPYLYVCKDRYNTLNCIEDTNFSCESN